MQFESCTEAQSWVDKASVMESSFPRRCKFLWLCVSFRVPRYSDVRTATASVADGAFSAHWPRPNLVSTSLHLSCLSRMRQDFGDPLWRYATGKRTSYPTECELVRCGKFYRGLAHAKHFEDNRERTAANYPKSLKMHVRHGMFGN